MFAAVSPREVANEPARNENGASASWFEDPIALGTLLIVLPPIGLAVVWSSKRYGTDARWALTVMTALMMCIFGAIVVAVMALRG